LTLNYILYFYIRILSTQDLSKSGPKGNCNNWRFYRASLATPSNDSLTVLNSMSMCLVRLIRFMFICMFITLLYGQSMLNYWNKEISEVRC